MTNREKLMELIGNCSAIEGYGEELREAKVGYLIANGVTIKNFGRWVLGYVEPGWFTPGGNRPWVCSECGKVVSWMLDEPRENFCPNCGADMRERKGDDGNS